MICTIKIEMPTNGICVKSNKYGIDQRYWHNLQANVFDVILKYFFHKKNTILHREMSLSCRVAVYVAERINVVLRLCQNRVCNNVKKDICD